MTEDQNDQSTDQPAAGPAGGPDAPMARDHGRGHCSAGGNSPAAGGTRHPVQADAHHEVPQGVPLGMAHTMEPQPDPVTGPQRVPTKHRPRPAAPLPRAPTPWAHWRATPRSTSRPLGLAGAAARGAGGYGGHAGSGPPTDPNAPLWSAPRVRARVRAARHNHTFRNGLLAGAAALALLGAGVGIGAAAWSSNDSSNLSALNASGGTRRPLGLGIVGQRLQRFALRQRLPLRWRLFGNGNSGNSGNAQRLRSTSGPSDVDAIAAKVDPGLVDVNMTLGYQQEQAAGTGIVLSSNGVILTNNHVIDGATSISVTDVGNHKTYTASVVGYDRTKDIAVLQLHNASGLQTATLNSSNVSVGQDVVGVGNAGGTGGHPQCGRRHRHRTQPVHHGQ